MSIAMYEEAGCVITVEREFLPEETKLHLLHMMMQALSNAVDQV